MGTISSETPNIRRKKQPKKTTPLTTDGAMAAGIRQHEERRGKQKQLHIRGGAKCNDVEMKRCF